MTDNKQDSFPSEVFATFDQHRVLLIIVNKSALGASLYEATRFAWRINREKAEQAEVILPTVQGVIVGAFIANTWLEATAENFPGREIGESDKGRFGFNGIEASESIQQMYIGKRIPDEFRKKGASNPIKYTWQ